MSSDDKYDAALDLLRRLDPAKAKTNLQNLISLEPELAEDLLSSIDLPLTIKQDSKSSNRDFLCCDYNRDMDSHRSPWSNDYFPQLSSEDLAESPFPSDKLRQLESLCNDSFDVYRDLYYEGGVSSVYLWDLDEDTDFAGVVLFKKSNSSTTNWDSIHVIEVTNSGNGDYNYKVTTTIILQLENNTTSDLKLSGNLTRQTERDFRVEGNKDEQIHIAHITNLGTLVEDIESQMRDMLETVYFEKTRDIFHQNKNSLISKNESEKTAQAEIVKGLQNL